MLAYITGTADPAAFHIPVWGREIRWYALAFVAGLILASWILSKMWKHEKLNSEWLDKLFIYIVVALIIGLRLGHILFYDPISYLKNPLEIFAIWHGGLASHGGAIGILVGVWIYSKRVTRKNMLWTLDRLVVPVGFVAALVRLGNLMNHEIYGHPTDVPWAFRFIENITHVQAGYPPIFSPPSHPTQLYEASVYIFTAFLCLWMYWKREDHKYPGLIFGIFLICVFLSRFFIEFLKEVQASFENNMILDMGQILSIPFIIAGIWFAYKGLKAKYGAREIKPVVQTKNKK